MNKMLNTFKQSVINIYNDLTIDIAGYIAYMLFLALFPFLILLMGLAGYIGTTQAAQTTISEIYQILPLQVVTEISPIISEVTQHVPQGGYIFIAAVFILWISTSSVEALRVGLNHAYKLNEERSFFFRRSQSLLFILLGSVFFLFAVGILVIFPLLLSFWHDIEKYLPSLPHLPSKLTIPFDIARIIVAYITVVIWFMVSYKWLPSHKIQLKKCLPGAFITGFLWLLAVGLYSIYLRDFARYDVLYGSLGGVIVTLIFFHISATVFLLGAHINKELQR